MRFLEKGLSLALLSSFLVILLLPGKLNTVFAAQEPGTQSPNPGSFEIPGSFKELRDSKDQVTSKRSPIQSDGVRQINVVEMEIDTEKVTGSMPALSFPESELLDFNATAYCLKGRTATGDIVRPGMIAADPRVLPLGTVVHLRAGSYTGIYKVTDTGGSIRGRKVDVYVPTRKEAIQFGRRQVKLKIISRSPSKTRPSTKNLEASIR